VDAVKWARTTWDRLVGWSLVVGGAALVLTGAVRVAGARYLADQLSFLMSAGVGGLGAIVFGSALLVTAGLHDEWCKLDRLEAAVRGDAAPRSLSSGEPQAAASEVSVAEPVASTTRPRPVALHHGAGRA
jgi:hypothetical protein